MKKLLLLFVFLVTVQVSAQEINEIKMRAFESAEASKSGNYKDLLSSFFQLAAKNISGENKSLDFNTTLFALKVKANEKYNQDIYFEKETFSRNLQFNFKANFDDDYKYTGFTGGLTYAIINGRDKQLANFTNTTLDSEFQKLIENIDAVQATQIALIYSDSETSEKAKAEKMASLQAARNAIINKTQVDEKDVYGVEYYNSLKGKYDADINSIFALADQYYKELEGKTLLTLSVDGTANDYGKFNRVSTEAVVLQGIKDSNFEMDLRGKFSYTDTLDTNLPRTDFKASAGINTIIGKKQYGNEKQFKSFFEIKAYFEYSAIFKNRLPDEEKENFLANADFRLRIADDLWLPLTLKYDIENANFLGFLNLTYNFKEF